MTKDNLDHIIQYNSLLSSNSTIATTNLVKRIDKLTNNQVKLIKEKKAEMNPYLLNLINFGLHLIL